MSDNPTPLPYARAAVPPPSGAFMRLWWALPDWVFRAAGAVLFLGFVAVRIPFYTSLAKFNSSGSRFHTATGQVWYAPWGHVLVDLTFLMIGLAFIFRKPPRFRPSRAGEVVLPLIAAFWPFVPFWTEGLLRFAARRGLAGVTPATVVSYDALLFSPTLVRFLVGSGLIILGNALDVWAYSMLFDSISIVPEARRLKVTGPYRWIRHPIYTGQIIAQGGVWLFYARMHVVWLVFYGCFVAMQMYRSRLEEAVLERAFGESYLEWKRRTVWIW